MLIDTHAHLDYSDYDPDRPEVIARAADAGVTEIISIGTRVESSTRAVELAENFPNIWATVGIHPCDVDEAPEDAIERLRALAQSPRVVALGEIGLDYHHLPEGEAAIAANKKRQAALFRTQLELAVELGLKRRNSSARFVGRYTGHPARFHRARSRGFPLLRRHAGTGAGRDRARAPGFLHWHRHVQERAAGPGHRAGRRAGKVHGGD